MSREEDKRVIINRKFMKEQFLLPKKKRIAFYHVVAIAMLAMATFSCSSSDTSSHDITILPAERISQAVPLEILDVWYPVDSIYPSRYYMYADSVLIVENKRGGQATSLTSMALIQKNS